MVNGLLLHGGCIKSCIPDSHITSKTFHTINTWNYQLSGQTFNPWGLHVYFFSIMFSLQLLPLSSFVSSYRLLWRRTSISGTGFVLDSDSVSLELLPPAVNKKHIPDFPFRHWSVPRPCWWSPLSLDLIDTVFQHCALPTSGFISVWQPCQYSPTKVGKKPSSVSMRWTNVLINLNIVEELSLLYVKLCAAMRVLCTRSA